MTKNSNQGGPALKYSNFPCFCSSFLFSVFSQCTATYDDGLKLFGRKTVPASKESCARCAWLCANKTNQSSDATVVSLSLTVHPFFLEESLSASYQVLQGTSLKRKKEKQALTLTMRIGGFCDLHMKSGFDFQALSLLAASVKEAYSGHLTSGSHT